MAVHLLNVAWLMSIFNLRYAAEYCYPVGYLLIWQPRHYLEHFLKMSKKLRITNPSLLLSPLKC
jgi:hypothetical protein